MRDGASLLLLLTASCAVYDGSLAKGSDGAVGATTGGTTTSVGSSGGEGGTDIGSGGSTSSLPLTANS